MWFQVAVIVLMLVQIGILWMIVEGSERTRNLTTSLLAQVEKMAQKQEVGKETEG